MPTCLSDCPWLLLMVIAKQTDIGNCRRWNLKGILVSDGSNESLGIKTFSPILLPVITFPSSTYLPIFVIINLVPLQRPVVGSKFLISITGTPTFNRILWSGSPKALIVFKNSGVWMSSGLFIIDGFVSLTHNLNKFSLRQVWDPTYNH